MLKRQIALYGKGGIGKSTTSGNLAAALADMGYHIMLVGCDPKQDSTMALSGGELLPSVLDLVREKGDENVKIEDFCFEGYGGTVLIEAGGPEPGVGCAGRGIIAVFNLMDNLKVFDVFDIDIVVYDVLGDVVCGGFAMPMRAGYAKEVYVVTSGEFMALYAANNICKAVKRFGESGNDIRLGGLICNSRNVINEVALVESVARQLSTAVVQVIPRSSIVQQSEAEGVTVVEYSPESEQTQAYIDLAKAILDKNHLGIPTPFSREELKQLMFDINNQVLSEQEIIVS
ncbi:AAA family ATPase [candidate division KSB1 bacterium]|nr:AAA family ATPase [candidate division KSB1 bacterium]NIR69347.1 AAA family ATPase [candidate division KSB1 bacterium]NIS24165.1 AAA family ATPase [candidate division KSB1 bacterium]NIT71080.1 AAA family ATPase [candidate division KSB1 bacterium]NIU24784.1 AAA family ATPase [candidate division KSB1 bacterium]